jgi:2-dehydro-3-deoxygluconokinase
LSKILTVGEPMVMFVADHVGSLAEVEKFTKYLAGAEVNVSIGLRRLGHHVNYITQLGQDPFGTYIFNYLEKEHIHTNYVTFNPDFPTGFQLKSRVESGDPEVVYFRKGSAASQMNPKNVAGIDFSDVDHLHITGIPLALSSSCREVIETLISGGRAAQIPLTFDPNLRPNLWPSPEEMVETTNRVAFQCDVVLPGLEEGFILTGYRDPSEIADFYLNQGVQAVVVKCGPEGAYVKTAKESFMVPGFPVEKVVDTVGAGDGFAVGFIDGVRSGKSLYDAVVQANAIGALQVMTQGDNDGLPDRQALDFFIENKVPIK